MDRYLTKKGGKCAAWEIPVAVLSALLVAAGVDVIAEDISAGNINGVIDVLAYLVAMALFALPLFFAVKRWILRGRACKIAGALFGRTEARLPASKLDGVTGVRGTAGRIWRLTENGFLRDLRFSEDGNWLILRDARPDEPISEPEDSGDSGDAVLARIRALNDAIDDEVVSEKIDRIEALTADIFRAVRQWPDRADEVRRFVNYYLPTTLRLLESYSLMEKQSGQGKNLTASRQGIEEALDKLILAIEQQQDRLFRAEAMDVEAEIQVLETLMRSEGMS